jgi:hypothetical protein
VNDFYCAQLFDREGYYSSVYGDTPEDVKAKVEQRTSKLKTILVVSLPFRGRWSESGLRDVSFPDDDWRRAFAVFDRATED